MHRAPPPPMSDEENRLKQHTVSWEGAEEEEEWLTRQPVDDWKQFFTKNGYLKVENLISQEDVEKYRDIYQRMLDGDINTSSHRHDLGSHVEPKKSGQENICQIMWPSLYVNGLEPDGKSPLHRRAVAIARALMGEDVVFDFDMLIYKAPHTDTETPWHQDQGYWPDMPDKRAVSVWVALDEARVENGCMWFVPGSHEVGVRPHRAVAEGKHVLTCEVSKDEGLPVPLLPGSCTFHHGRTAHHTGPNTTDTQRRAYIINARPRDMVEYERQRGFDHGKKGVVGVIAKSKSHSS